MLVIISVFETRAYRKIKNKANGKSEKIVVSKLDYKIQYKIQFHDDILAVEWLNASVRDLCIVLICC